MALINGDGTVYNIHLFGNQSLSKTWDMKLPSSTKHFLFTNERKIYAIYGDGKKNMTYIKSNEFHRKIPKSNVPYKCGDYTIHTRIGDFVWLVGGSLDKLQAMWGTTGEYVFSAVLGIVRIANHTVDGVNSQI